LIYYSFDNAKFDYLPIIINSINFRALKSDNFVFLKCSTLKSIFDLKLERTLQSYSIEK
jgi:hypothetical protein